MNFFSKENGLSFLLLPLALILFTAANALLFPARFYSGDANAIRFEALNWVRSGHLGIDYSEREALTGLVDVKGQFFIENDQRQRFYSRWGIGNTLLYAIPAYFTESKDLKLSSDFLLSCNWFHLGLGSLLFIYLTLIGLFYTNSPWAILTFLASIFYGTFLWSYLRAQTYEIFQTLLFAAIFYHFVSSLRSQTANTSERSRSTLLHFCAAQGLLLFLIHCKSFYAITYPSILAILIWKEGRTFWMRPMVLLTFAFAAVAVVSHVLLIHYKTGLWLLSGEGAALPGTPQVWSLKNFPDRFHEYTVGIKGSLFLFCPPFFLALLFWPRFLRKWPLEAAFIGSLFLLSSSILFAFYTRGEFCLGPRYYLFLCPLLCLPLLEALSGAQDRWTQILVVCSLVLSTGFYGFLQWNFNSRPYFLRHQLYGFFVDEKPHTDRAKRYLLDTSDLTIAFDFNSYLAGNAPFPPVQELLGQNPNIDGGAFEYHVRQRLSQEFPCNYWFDFLCPSELR